MIDRTNFSNFGLSASGAPDLHLRINVDKNPLILPYSTVFIYSFIKHFTRVSFALCIFKNYCMTRVLPLVW